MNRTLSFTLILTLLIITCSSQKIFFKKEYEIESLNLNEDQKEFVSSKLDTIHILSNDFNSISASDNETMKNKLDILSEIYDKILNINDRLSEGQKQVFKNSELVQTSLYSGQKLITKFNKKRRLDKHSDIKGNKTNMEINSVDHFSETWNNNTVIIGSFGAGRGPSGGGMMIPPFGGRRSILPVSLRATFLDNSLKDYLEKNNYHKFENSEDIYIFISISTNLHNSYLNLDKWIIYLENTKLEKAEISQYFEKENPPETKDKLEKFNTKFREFSRFAFLPDIPRRMQVNTFRLSFRRKFYILSFKNNIFQNNPKYIKLVLLEEIGSNIKDEGRWYFKEY